MRKAYLFLVAFIAWSVLFWYYYVFNIRLAGTNTSTSSTAIVEPDSTTLIAESKPLLFKPQTYGLLLDRSAQSIIDSILALGNDDQKLQITGYAAPSEQVGLDFDLGLARASELKKLLIDDLVEDRIEIFSDTIGNFTYYKDSLVDALVYEWVDGYEATTTADEDFYLIDHDTKRIKTEDFEELFTKIAERIAVSGEKVIIRGHTDSGGKSDLNFTIALRNAKDIRDVFKAKGVNRKQITTTSNGEDTPIADNETTLGRQQNRRIEIEIQEK